MGKRIISQRRGRGTSRYASPSHRFKSQFSMVPQVKEAVKGNVSEIMHCPGHTSPVAVVKYENGQLSHIPAPEGMRVNDVATSFLQGARDLLGAALVVGMAKGIVLVLGGDQASEPSVLNTLLHGAGQLLDGVPAAAPQRCSAK